MVTLSVDNSILYVTGESRSELFLLFFILIFFKDDIVIKLLWALSVLIFRQKCRSVLKRPSGLLHFFVVVEKSGHRHIRLSSYCRSLRLSCRVLYLRTPFVSSVFQILIARISTTDTNGTTLTQQRCFSPLLVKNQINSEPPFFLYLLKFVQ